MTCHLDIRVREGIKHSHTMVENTATIGEHIFDLITRQDKVGSTEHTPASPVVKTAPEYSI